jgi:hypothetical protein
MVIRRIREHVTAHNWFAVGIDLAIVVLGVFIGTQANNWNEARLERHKAQVYRERLISDLRQNERQMNQRRDYYSAVLAHATAALDAYKRPASELGEQFLIDSSQTTQIYSTAPKRFTYDSMIASGDLDLLGELGDRVGTYYALLDNVVHLTGQYPPYRERFRREIPYDVENPIRQRCSDINVEDARGILHTSLPAACSIGLDKATVARGVDRLRAAPELDRDLSRYVFFLSQTLDLLNLTETRARKLREIVERSGG